MPFILPTLLTEEILQDYAAYLEKTAIPNSPEARECKEVILTCHEYFGNGNKIIAMLAEALATTCSVTWLCLTSDLIDNRGLEVLAPVMEKNKSIHRLTLSGNMIGRNIDPLNPNLIYDDDEARREFALFVDALKFNPILQKLDLSINYFGLSDPDYTGDLDPQINILAAALPDLHVLTLNLSQNGIDDAGLIAIAAGLKRNRSITSIILERNKFGYAGLAALADALEENTTLTEVIIYRGAIRNQAIVEVMSRINVALARNSFLAHPTQAPSPVRGEESHTPSDEVSGSGGSSLQGSGHKNESSNSSLKSSDHKSESSASLKSSGCYNEDPPSQSSPGRPDAAADAEVASLLKAVRSLSSSRGLHPLTVTDASAAPEMSGDPDKKSDAERIPTPLTKADDAETAPGILDEESGEERTPTP